MRFRILLSLVLPVLVLPGFKNSTVLEQSGANPAPAPGPYKVVGYLEVNRPDLPAALSNIDFRSLSHLNLAFVNPDSTGAFADRPAVRQIVASAHAAGVKVLMSIGGGEIPRYFAGLLSDDKRPALVRSIATLVDQYRLDGIDVDLEGSAIDQHYTQFVTELASITGPRGKLLTAAVATPYGANTPDAALAKFDFVNIMSYDKTGPWRPADPGPHAPYDMAVSDLVYWGTTRSLPKSKMTLGLPFYGYGFGPGNSVSDMNFSQIAAAYPAAVNEDQVGLPNGGTMYYNGIATIRKKTALAMQQADGVMIWELTQDAPAPNSLLKNIRDVLSSE
ncbi:MAG: glycosyl hydrolase family 18 protein [Puia sp.]|nr:glycosyl hydrolase family 18 protein [Puia sp.]